VASVVGLRATIVGSAVLLAIAVVVTMVRYPWLRVLDESQVGFDAHVERDDVDPAQVHLVVEPLDQV
jgi:hypothetical protein